jgi:hypothetical protein
MSTFNFDGFSMRQCISNLFPGGYHQPVKCRLRNVHLFCTVRMVSSGSVIPAPAGLKEVKAG